MRARGINPPPTGAYSFHGRQQSTVLKSIPPPCTTVSETPAPLWIRAPAFLLDQAVVVVVVVGPVLLAGVGVDAVLTPGETRTAVFLALNAAAFVYHFLLELRWGETIGKRLFGLEVLTDEGGSLDARASFLRNALRAIDGLGYWTVAVVVILIRGDGKRLGDVVGRTLVVRKSSS